MEFVNAKIENKIAAEAFKQVKEEARANEGYMELLSMLEEINDSEGIKIVKEIMSDETNHLLKNLVIALKYSNTVVSKDEADKALDFIEARIAQ